MHGSILAPALQILLKQREVRVKAVLTAMENSFHIFVLFLWNVVVELGVTLIEFKVVVVNKFVPQPPVYICILPT